MIFDLFRKTEKTRYHRECAQCCSIGRCHWCLKAVGDLKIVGKGTFRKHNGRTFRGCAPHLQRLMTDPCSPFGGTQAAAFTVVPVTLR